MGRGTFEGKKGFTLIEIVMVLVIIGLLASIVVPQFTEQMDDARKTQTRANLENLRSAVAMYVRRYNENPADLTHLVSRGIMKAVPTDAWARDFAYDAGTAAVDCNPATTECDVNW